MAIPSSHSSKTSAAAAEAVQRKKAGGTRNMFGVGFLPFSCGCRGSKAASASSPSRTATTSSTSSSSTATSSGTEALPRHDSDSLTLTTAASGLSLSPSPYPALLLKQPPTDKYDDDDHSTPVGTPTITDLLRQLSDLEQAVMSLDTRPAPEFPAPEAVNRQDRRPERAPVGRSMSFATESRTEPRQTHRRSRSDGEGSPAAAVGWASVAVETETADPVGDFARSMMEVITEEGIADGRGSEGEVEERLRGLLRRFLALNHPSNHHYVVRAFSLVLDEVCASAPSSPPSSCSLDTAWVEATAPTFSAGVRRRRPNPRRGRY